MGLRTPLYDMHLALGAKMIDFSGWDMPLHYGSQVEEHHQVRRECGLFDVSHMCTTDISGADAHKLLQLVLANDVARLTQLGAGHYSAMLNQDGGVIDDMMVFSTSFGYRLITNASSREKTNAWLKQQAAGMQVEIALRDDLAHFAIQGPLTLELVCGICSPARAELIHNLQPYQSAFDDEWFFSRTGYTGEDGIEVIFPASKAVDFFNELIANGVTPVGLGARDTLRLEAGFTLLGNDMDENFTPCESNMHHVVALQPTERNFIGRARIEQQASQGVSHKIVGLVLEERGVLRAGQPVRIEGTGEGTITSGSFSPTIGKAIALARVPVTTGERGEVEIRGKWYPVRIVKPRFVRNGQILI